MSSRIRTGIIGVGGMGRAHLRWIKDVPEIQVVAICDISPDSIAITHEKHPEVKQAAVYEDYREMLEKEKLDAVEIVTPHTLHYPMIMDSLDAGCHVLVEKPMVCTVADALKVREKRDATGKKLLVSYQRHYDPKFIYAKRLVEEGKLGELQFVSITHGQSWYPSQRGKWRQDPALSGGGQLNDSGSHLVDVIHWISGAGPKEVFAIINNLDTRVDINSSVTWKLTNGAQGTLSVYGNFPLWWEDHTYSGSKGALIIRQQNVTLALFGQEPVTPDYSKIPHICPERNFVDAILKDAEIASPLEGALRVIEFTEAAWKSAATGKLVKVEKHF